MSEGERITPGSLTVLNCTPDYLRRNSHWASLRIVLAHTRTSARLEMCKAPGYSPIFSKCNGGPVTAKLRVPPPCVPGDLACFPGERKLTFAQNGAFWLVISRAPPDEDFHSRGITLERWISGTNMKRFAVDVLEKC